MSAVAFWIFPPSKFNSHAFSMFSALEYNSADDSYCFSFSKIPALKHFYTELQNLAIFEFRRSSQVGNRKKKDSQNFKSMNSTDGDQQIRRPAFECIVTNAGGKRIKTRVGKTLHIHWSTALHGWMLPEKMSPLKLDRSFAILCKCCSFSEVSGSQIASSSSRNNQCKVSFA